jgi:hypothetical protein
VGAAVSTPRAADLPVGSVVAARIAIDPETEEYIFGSHQPLHVVFLRQDLGTIVGIMRWSQVGPTGGGVVAEARVQNAIDNGGQVLRVGDGSER